MAREHDSRRSIDEAVAALIDQSTPATPSRTVERPIPATGVLITDGATTQILAADSGARQILAADAGRLIGHTLGEILDLTPPDAPPEATSDAPAAGPLPLTEVQTRGDGKPSRRLLVRRDRLALDGRTWIVVTLLDPGPLDKMRNECEILETELARAQKMESIGALAAGIAHEINTPTQYVGDNTRFLKDAFTDLLALLEIHETLRCAAAGPTPITGEILEKIEEAREKADLDYLREEIPQAIDQSLEGVERVTRIVRAMKEFSHPGSEEKVPIDINRALQTTVTVTRNEWKYVADLRLDLIEDLPLTPGFPGELNQVFLNLVVNAAHAIGARVGDGSQGKGTITLRTRTLGHHVVVEVSDTGTGIPEAIRQRIFEPFFTTKPLGKGTGQGLAIVRSVVVEKHGGRIEVDSTEGAGTTIRVVLPLESQEPSTGD